MPKFFDAEAGHEADFLTPRAGRRIHLHRRSGTRVPARNGRRSATDPRRRSRSRPPHGARQTTDAEGHQPFGAGAAAWSWNSPKPLKKGSIELESVADLGDVEEGTPADVRVRTEAAKQFADVAVYSKKLQQLQEKVDATPVANKRPRKRLCAKLNRAKVETSLAIRRVPFRPHQVEGVRPRDRARRRRNQPPR